MLGHWSSIATSLSVLAGAAAPLLAADGDDAANPAAALAKIGGQQQRVELPVRVVDHDGKPIVKAKVIPWALRSSQGHGWWRDDPEDRANMAPQEVFTDVEGRATVKYPKFRDVEEGVQTIGVSLQVDHPEFAYADDLHIEVPLEQDSPHEIKLEEGASVVVRPRFTGDADAAGEILAVWSDGRSWRSDAAIKNLADGSLEIPVMSPGENSLLLIKLDGERATHFSTITDFELTAGEPEQLDVELRPAIRVTGVLSENVPRPVKNGRVKVETLRPSAENYDRVMWFSWAPVEADGTFMVEAWPAGETMQLIALCGGYIAESGEAPSVVKNAPDPKDDFFNRPQVFDEFDEPIEVAMTPMQTCVVRAVDEGDSPVAGVEVGAWPNVGWWNHGSQIYCNPLVRGERLLRLRDYQAAEDKAFPPPFRAKTDAQGEARLELPIGKESLAVHGDIYELPVFLGRRSVDVELSADEAAEATLLLQPRGTDKLGEWDKLAGVVFGCSTREGRRICALPGVQKKMEEFTRRFREAKDQQDPHLLSEAYTAVAEAFTGVGDLEQAALWRGKAAEQREKAKRAEGSKKSAKDS